MRYLPRVLKSLLSDISGLRSALDGVGELLEGLGSDCVEHSVDKRHVLAGAHCSELESSMVKNDG